MTERFRPERPVSSRVERLTSLGHAPTLRSERNFMVDETGGGPDQSEAGKPQAERPELTIQSGLKREPPLAKEELTLRQDWLNYYGGILPKDANERSTIEKLIQEGARPQRPQEGTSDARALLRGEHFGPGAMNAPDPIFDPADYASVGLQSVARRIEAAKVQGSINPSLLQRRALEIQNIIVQPGLTQDDLDKAEEMITDVESWQSRLIANSQDVDREEISKRQAERLLKGANARKEREKYFNSLFEVVDAVPHEFFDKAFNQFRQGVQYDIFMQLLIQASKNDVPAGVVLTQDEIREAKEDFERFQHERRVKEALHNVNAILYLPSVKGKQLLESMQQYESLLGDYAVRNPGLVEMMNLYEGMLREEMAVNGGYLPPETITGKIDSRTEDSVDANGNLLFDQEGHKIVDTYLIQVSKEGTVEEKAKARFKEFVNKYGLTGRNESGQITRLNLPPEGLQNWEIDRTFIAARGMMIMNGRLLSVAAEGKLGDGLSQYSSLFLQDILQSYSPFIHLIGKYGITESHLTAYLFNPDEKTKKFLGILNIWDPNTLKKTLAKYNKNERSILESPNEFFYLMQQNPNRAGDMYTWQSWRYADDPETPSAIKDFVAKGRERMHHRWDTHHQNAPTSDVYENFIHQRKYNIPRNAAPEKGDFIKETMKKDWGEFVTANNLPADTPTLENYVDYVNEYLNWVGTGLRFERMRGTFDKLEKPELDDNGYPIRGEVLRLWNEQKTLPGRRGEAVREADKLFERMVSIQPHRLYLLSERIQKRINARLGLPEAKFQTQQQKERVERILKNLSALEIGLFRNREELLEAGKTFDNDNKVSLEDILQIGVIDDPNEAAEVRLFMQAFSEDYESQKDKYLEEFVYRRETRHGFVLWGGDIPQDEFGMSALGPTGSFVRRARDNMAQIEAFEEEVKLLNGITEIKTPEDLIKQLDVIYLKIQGYSGERAKEAMGYKLEGFLKFFAESSTTKIPVFGIGQKMVGKSSFAQIMYGGGMPAWAAPVLRDTITRMKNHHRITESKAEELYGRVGAGWGDVFVDSGVTFGELLIAYLLYYSATRIYKGK